MIFFIEIVEPLEELTFASGPLLSTLAHRSRLTDSADLRSRDTRTTHANHPRSVPRHIADSGLQISKGLDFLHQFAKLVHASLTPLTWIVLIDAAVSLSSACTVTRDLILTSGDWKFTGPPHTTPPIALDGSPTRWKFPEHHSSLPCYIQKSFDCMGTPYAFITKVYNSGIRV